MIFYILMAYVILVGLTVLAALIDLGGVIRPGKRVIFDVREFDVEIEEKRIQIARLQCEIVQLQKRRDEIAHHDYRKSITGQA